MPEFFAYPVLIMDAYNRNGFFLLFNSNSVKGIKSVMF